MCSDGFWEARRGQTPLESAPDICVDVASPSNTLRDLHAKVRAYLDAGATEAWLVFPRSKRVEFHGRSGPALASSLTVDLSTLFD
jgi:Uma2 family endonuclease